MREEVYSYYPCPQCGEYRRVGVQRLYIVWIFQVACSLGFMWLLDWELRRTTNKSLRVMKYSCKRCGLALKGDKIRRKA